jgi:hypothetical protein
MMSRLVDGGRQGVGAMLLYLRGNCRVDVTLQTQNTVLSALMLQWCWWWLLLLLLLSSSVDQM